MSKNVRTLSLHWLHFIKSPAVVDRLNEKFSDNVVFFAGEKMAKRVKRVDVK